MEKIARVHWQMGTLYLEVTPARLSDRAAARTLDSAFGDGPDSFEVVERLELRRYVLSGGHRTFEEWENRTAIWA
ncbi:hypothetical protein [Streptomyces sp. NPDC053560]|uniref:hypothetical protein n=1 Tax=Streptomyces sp. NPDC053560 TaxID=3365711 RepID=UPI0037D2A7DA